MITMNKFTQGINNSQKWKLTENGADALKSTTNALLDLFATIGALRSRTERDVENAFDKAFATDPLSATKMSFYARNIRGGLGERKVSRTIWRWLAYHQPEIMKKNIHLVPVFGRWDDLYTFVGTEVEPAIWELISHQWNQDLKDMTEGKPISLLGKWLKSVNTSSPESVKLGKLTATILGYTEREYRKYLSAFRSYLKVVEKSMSSKEWDGINYEQVPSKAMTNYRKAFSKQDPTRFVKYLESVKKGTAKINSGTLYPYDIVEKIMRGENSAVLEEQWKALPNYVEGENNMLVMADVSGSMSGRPIATSVGLAIYFAERNKGPFHNLFMTFSSRPEFVTLKGSSLASKIANASSAHWEQNTDFEAAFREILRVAVANKVPQEDMPKALICISDMEFDTATRGYGRYQKVSYFDIMTKLYNDAGYVLPTVVFWNVSARQDTFHAEMQDGVQFASGQSTSVFKSILGAKNLGPYEMMMNVLNDPQYDVVTI
jgi:hypothetical protein